MGVDIIEIVKVLIAGGVFTALFKFIRWYLERKDRKNAEEVVKGLQKVFEGFEHMEDMVDEEIHRAMLFSGHNCGGIPRLNASFYVTALRAVDENSNIDWKDYKHVEADHAYVKILRNVEADGIQLVRTKELPNCLLKEYYMAEGIQESVIMFLKILDRELIYVSASTRSEEGISDKTITKLKLKANLLSECL